MKLLIGAGQFAAASAFGQGLHLLLQLELDAGQEFRVLRGVYFVLGAASDFIPGGGDDFLLALGNLRLILIAGLARHASTTGLGLGVVLLKRLRFDERDICPRGIPGVFGGCVDADDVARFELIVFERDEMVLPLASFTPRLASRGDGLFGSAVHRIVELHRFEGEIVRGFHGDGDFFDGADFGIASGRDDLYRGRLILTGFDKVVLA